METLHEENPKSYRKLIDKLRGIEIENVSEAVEPPTWVSHFQNLNKPKPKFTNRQIQLENILAELAGKCFSIPDSRKTMVEISNAISKLKRRKALGLDNISNYICT